MDEFETRRRAQQPADERRKNPSGVNDAITIYFIYTTWGRGGFSFFFKFRFSVDVFGCLYEAKPLANIANKTKHLNKTFSKWSNGTSVYFCSRLKEEKPIKNGCCPSLVKWRTRRSRSTLMCNRVKSQTFQRSSGLHCLWLRSAPPPQCFVRAEQSRPGRMEPRKTL